MLQSERNPLEIADAIPIRVLERSGIDLVDHFPLPPILLHNDSKVFRCGVLCSLREKSPAPRDGHGANSALRAGGREKSALIQLNTRSAP